MEKISKPFKKLFKKKSKDKDVGSSDQETDKGTQEKKSEEQNGAVQPDPSDVQDCKPCEKEADAAKEKVTPDEAPEVPKEGPPQEDETEGKDSSKQASCVSNGNASAATDTVPLADE